MKALSRWWFFQAPPERLATLRIAIGLFAWIYLIARLPHFASFSAMSPSAFRPVGPVGILVAPLPAWSTWTLAILAVASGAAFVIGWRFVITGPLFAATLLWVTSYASSWGMIFHTDNLLVLHVIVLALASAAAAWSVDARGKEAIEESDRFGWPLRLMAAITVLAYFMAGIAKLKNEGLTWVTTDFLREYVAYDALRKAELGSTHSPLGAWLAQHSWPWRPLAALSLTMELAAPLALLGRRAAMVWAIAAIAFHAGVLALMAILFLYPLIGLAFAPLFPVERAANALLRFAKRRVSSAACRRACRSPARS
jgi:hypothetical protein